MSGLGDQDARIAGQGVTVPSRDAGAGQAMDGQKPAWMSLLDRVNVTYGRLVSQQSRAELGRVGECLYLTPLRDGVGPAASDVFCINTSC